MRRYETLLEGMRHNVRSDMSPRDIERLAEPLVHLNNYEAKVALAYKVCGCGANYTETQWARLLPVPGRPWTWDVHVQEEWRECNDCGAALAVLEKNGQRRPANTIPFKSIASGFHCCGWCLRTIKPGALCVERLEKRNGMRAVGRWAFCSSECEAA